ncbi:unnamed protein product, partial [Clonostachys rosea]
MDYSASKSVTIVTAVYASVLLLLLFAGFRLVFHPLKKYPGPLISKLTGGYAGFHAIKKDLHLATYRDHLKYGSVYRQSPNRLVFNSVEALHDIYANPHVTKADSYKYTRMRNKTSLFNALEKKDHRRRRSIIGHVISEQSMRKFEPTMMSQVDIFLEQLLLSSQRTETVNVTPRFQHLAIDIICLLGFGYSMRSQVEEKMRFVGEAMNAVSARLNIFMTWSVFASLDPGIQFIFKSRIERLRDTLGNMIEERMAKPKDAVYDLLSITSDATIQAAEQEGLRGSELWAEAGIFFTAGGSTTATALSSAFFYLSRHPAAYETLASEIRTTFESASDIRGGPKLTGCKYLRAVIDETMRMSPPSLGTPWRQEDPMLPKSQPFVVDGHEIPSGTVVGVNTYCIHHNEKYFPDSFSFRPDRWLEKEGETLQETKARATMRRAFAPFSIGERSCAGKAMAYLELNLTLAKTLWYFDFEKTTGRHGQLGAGKPGAALGRHRPTEYQLYDIFTADHDGPNLVFTTRGEYWRELVSYAETL